MKRLLAIFLIFISGVLITGCLNQPVYRQSAVPLQTVAAVDLNKYLGKWYEIYRLPNWFEDDDCVTVTAEYGLRSDGGVSVLNTCHKASKQEEAKGIAKIVEGSNNSKLRVSFFRPFYGDYWILDLANDYSWVLIGEPAGKYFWILARDRKLSPELEESLLVKAEKLGYSRKDLVKPSNQ
jgi:apolipoprotein D and lipocalin family protein